MLFALIALVVLTLGGVALVRSIDAGTMTLGNLGFRRASLSAATVVAEKAIDKAYALGTTGLQSDGAKGTGYYATAVPDLDPLATISNDAHPVSQVDWKGDGCKGSEFKGTRRCLTPVTGEFEDKSQAYAYVVTRLCPNSGAGGDAGGCMVPLVKPGAADMSRGIFSSLGRIEPKATVTFYRVVSRIQDKRGVVSVTETLVHF
ncbi:MAG TPA: hypothetical protein VK195_08755 [Burkholderiaceae bacterium]|nr:hypothetical protein [Burkholderiaceae bacterium]